MFYHSLVSDWNHGNAHFLRGVAMELIKRGHDLTIYEPADSWSATNLLAEFGRNALDEFHSRFPLLKSVTYRTDRLDLNQVLARANLVLVHEWNDPALVRRIGQHRAR